MNKQNKKIIVSAMIAVAVFAVIAVIAGSIFVAAIGSISVGMMWYGRSDKYTVTKTSYHDYSSRPSVRKTAIFSRAYNRDNQHHVYHGDGYTDYVSKRKL